MKSKYTPVQIMAFHAATGVPVMQAKAFMADQSPELVERIFRAALASLKLPDVHALAKVSPDLIDRIFRAAEMRSEAGYLVDPIQDDPEVGPTVRRVLEETSATVLREEGQKRGICHRIWSLAQDRLAKEHKITWYTPAEMNPSSHFS